MKKTAKDTAVMQEAVKLLKKQHTVLPVDEEAALDVIGDVERFAIRIHEAATSSVAELADARKKIRKYLLKNAE